jgi:hypothetical protein
VGALTAPTSLGTHVPVEEPSTASIAAVSMCSKKALLDHLVGAGE